MENEVDAEDLTAAVDRSFARNVKRMRERVGWSQLELAQRLSEIGVPGFHQTTVARIESGQRALRASEAIAVARLLECRVEDLAESSNMAELRESRQYLNDRIKQLRDAAQELTHARMLTAMQLDRKYPYSKSGDLDEYRRTILANDVDDFLFGYVEETLLDNSDPVDIVEENVRVQHEEWRTGLTPWVMSRMLLLAESMMTVGWRGLVVNEKFESSDDDFERDVLVHFGEIDGEHREGADWLGLVVNDKTDTKQRF
ncbi:helix-turn-helix transcriptional regulator [Subtercola endophyticus]|uniref:helix-turn-helix transcriptional regulator n=1 Tax=Subtercola endophyticus TaxID=2895559 RepID=UPI001E31418B|nr:helix-turn-helix transcriptional regulator [Subtercola endophyticus]UFS58917.1 helix-turn-helix domain-containing protein [Subtercola endophyticus]